MTERARAERFVRGLFKFVLDRKSCSVEEVEYWTQRLIDHDDPIDVFERFACSKENEDRRQLLADSQTQYPDGHFYSPVVSRGQVKADRERVFGERGLVGVRLNDNSMRRRFEDISPHFAAMPFGTRPDGHHRYHYGNSSFGFGDACIYWGMLATLRPRRLIEVGSGYTSALALDAIDHLGLATRCTFIDPFPELALKVTAPLDARHEVVARPIQQVDPLLVAELRAGDLLFIDSSHVVKTGSDVHFEITELLPRLRTGVVVHFHDIFYPFEYPEAWVLADNKSWNELYFIHALLLFNEAFEINYFNDYFCKFHSDLISRLDAETARRMLLNPGGGIWLEKL